jgi:hypothetical protein
MSSNHLGCGGRQVRQRSAPRTRRSAAHDNSPRLAWVGCGPGGEAERCAAGGVEADGDMDSTFIARSSSGSCMVSQRDGQDANSRRNLAASGFTYAPGTSCRTFTFVWGFARSVTNRHSTRDLLLCQQDIKFFRMHLRCLLVCVTGRTQTDKRNAQHRADMDRVPMGAWSASKKKGRHVHIWSTENKRT